MDYISSDHDNIKKELKKDCMLNTRGFKKFV